MAAHTDTLNIRLPAGDAAAARSRAADEGVSVSELVRRALTGVASDRHPVTAAVQATPPTDPVAAALALRYAAVIDRFAGTDLEPQVLAQLGPKLTALAVGVPAKGGAAPAPTPPTPSEPTSGPVSTLAALRAKRAG